MIVDTHCHLADDAFADDLGDVLARVRAAGVTHFLAVGEEPRDNRGVLALAAKHEGVLAGVGHYPAHLDPAVADESERLLRERRDDVALIGEIGIDHWLAKELEDRARQHENFRRFVRLGRELDLPLSVHSRSAGHHALRILAEEGAERVCMHAFDGKARFAREGAERGFFFSVPPSIVRSTQKQKMVAALSLDRLLLESDAPVLGPEPGTRNEPANVLMSADKIAEIKGESLDTVLSACAENSRILFGI